MKMELFGIKHEKVLIYHILINKLSKNMTSEYELQ